MHDSDPASGGTRAHGAEPPARAPAMEGQERKREPPPLIARRLPSGRGATEQPNAAGDGAATLSARFWIALVLTGVGAGLFGTLMLFILFSVEHLAFGYKSGDLEHAAARLADLRRIAPLLVAGVVGGPAWYLLRRYTQGETSEVDDAVWRGDSRLSFRRSLGTSIISEVVVGLGASLGREQAPKLMGGASGSVVSHWLGLTSAQRRVVVACGAGAGLAAVYNVPLGGALFTVEIMLGAITLSTVLPALVCSFIATAIAWIYLPNHATYADVPAYGFSVSLLAAAFIMGPVIGLVATVYVRIIGWVSHHRAAGRSMLIAPLAALAVLGLIGFVYPQLFGNGKAMAHDAFIGSGTVWLFLALFALKPLVTAMCLSSGATGGLFTPTLSTGAMLGAMAGILWSHLWPASPVGAFALVGAAATAGASMQAPLTGIVLLLELTGGGLPLAVPIMAATLIATAVVRWLDGYSIYSARLPGGREPRRGTG